MTAATEDTLTWVQERHARFMASRPDLRSVASRTAALRNKVEELVHAAGLSGLTGGELIALLPNEVEYSLRPRLTDLKRDGVLFTGKTKRENKRGNPETVFIHRDFAGGAK